MTWKHWVLIAGAILLIAAATYSKETSFLDSMFGLVKGSFQDGDATSATLKDLTALLITGLAVFVALRAGLFNIGVEGQFLVGGLSGAVIGLWLPGFWGVFLGIIAGVLAGFLWALPAGLIRAYRGGHEVITTIMMNFIAISITTALVAGPLRDRLTQAPTTATMPPGSTFPYLWYRPPWQISFALVVAIMLVVGFGLWLKRAVAGYEVEAVGANPRAATIAGVDAKRVQLWAMSVSGALAGLAGTLHVFAYEGRFYSGISPGYGFDALAVGLLAGSSWVGILPASLLFAILNRGSASLQMTGIPKETTMIVLGVLIIVFAALRYRGKAVRT